jgi:hypothetical protein
MQKQLLQAGTSAVAGVALICVFIGLVTNTASFLAGFALAAATAIMWLMFNLGCADVDRRMAARGWRGACATERERINVYVWQLTTGYTAITLFILHPYYRNAAYWMGVGVAASLPVIALLVYLAYQAYQAINRESKARAERGALSLM